MFSSKVWLGATIVFATITLALFGTGGTWAAALSLLAAIFSGLWSMVKLEDEYKETNINW